MWNLRSRHGNRSGNGGSSIGRKHVQRLGWIALVIIVSVYANAQATLPTSEVLIAPMGGFNAYWANGLNVAASSSGELFTDSDGSRWGCYANTSPIVPIVFHIVGSTVTSTNPGLTAWSTNDTHNACTLAIDSSGFIWMCYDQHVTALNCYKSNSARNASAFTKVSPLVNSTNEANVTFPVLFTNPSTHALYLIYLQGTGFQTERGFFYCYNAGTLTWSGCAGTSTNGQMFSNSFPSTWLQGLPQWDKTTGYAWFSWQWQDATTPFWNCGDATAYPCAEWTVGWTGSGFVDIHGNAIALPMTPTNPNPAVTIHSGIGPSFSILDSTSIDSNETLFMPFIDVDVNGFLQIYVTWANLHTGTTGGPIQLTSNNSVFNPPSGAGWLGPSNNCANAPYSCGEYVGTVAAISSGACTWVTYPDWFNWGNGLAAYKSCDNFSSSTFVYLSSRFSPNENIFPDQVRNYTTGAISLLFEQTNNTQFNFSTFISSQPNLYEITWSPGGSVINNSATLSGAANLQ